MILCYLINYFKIILKLFHEQQTWSSYLRSFTFQKKVTTILEKSRSL